MSTDLSPAAPAIAPKVPRAERHLPPEAIERLRFFEDAWHDALAASRLSSENFNEAQTRFSSLENELRSFDRRYLADGGDRRFYAEAKATLEQKVADAKPVRDRAKRAYDARHRTADQAGQLLTALRKYAEHLTTPVRLAPAAAPRPGDPVMAIEAIRARLAAIDEERTALRLAPFPSAEAKVLATAEIEALAAKGKPDVGDLLHEKRPIRWPEASVIAASGLTVDTLAVLAHLFRVEMTKAVHAAIDEASDDGLALTAEQRVKRRAELDAEKLALERVEEATIAAANRNDLSRRPKADPRALLGLSDDAPEPRESYL